MEEVGDTFGTRHSWNVCYCAATTIGNHRRSSACGKTTWEAFGCEAYQRHLLEIASLLSGGDPVRAGKLAPVCCMFMWTVVGGLAAQKHSEWRKTLMLAIPTVFDLIATVLMNVGLLSVTASVYQMMRGAEMLFAALFAVLFLERRLNKYHYGGILCCVVWPRLPSPCPPAVLLLPLLLTVKPPSCCSVTSPSDCLLSVTAPTLRVCEVDGARFVREHLGVCRPQSALGLECVLPRQVSFFLPGQMGVLPG